MKRACLAAVAAVLISAACVSTFDFRREELFEDTAKRYGRLMRWSEFDMAQSYLAADVAPEKKKFPVGIQLSEYEVLQIGYSPDRLQAVQAVKITYFHVNNPKVRTIEDLQLWEFNPEKGGWFLKSGFPKFQ